MTTANHPAAHPDLRHRSDSHEPTTVVVEAWPDPLIENDPRSHPTASGETLLWWTPVLGPTATLMAHRFATVLAHQPRLQITTDDLARTFGMGNSNGRVRATLARLERFDVVTTHAQSVYLRMALPALTSRHLEQLPGYLRDLYQQRHR
ncbi:MAG: hypothetical protein MUE36_07185 [Acidimicrobiales bacterium]|jgi:hypothetical protein|nr:hypothetical protein [Acidimicrobiales bacterium]